MTFEEAKGIILQELNKGAVPAGWVWDVRDQPAGPFNDHKITLFALKGGMEAAFEGASVRNFAYYSDFGNQTSPLVYNDPYGATASVIVLNIRRNGNFFAMANDRLSALDRKEDTAAITRDEAIRRQTLLQLAQEAQAEEARQKEAEEAAAAAEAERQAEARRVEEARQKFLAEQQRLAESQRRAEAEAQAQAAEARRAEEIRRATEDEQQRKEAAVAESNAKPYSVSVLVLPKLSPIIDHSYNGELGDLNAPKQSQVPMDSRTENGCGACSVSPPIIGPGGPQTPSPDPFTKVASPLSPTTQDVVPVDPGPRPGPSQDSIKNIAIVAAAAVALYWAFK